MKETDHWLSNSLSMKPSSFYLSVNEGRIHVLEWGKKNNTSLIFLHGGLANAYWFAAIAPHFSDRFHVLAVDFPGHGRSSWYPKYSGDLFDQVLHSLLDTHKSPSIIVAHSMGARIARSYYIRHLSKIRGVCLLDPPGIPFGNYIPGAISPRKTKYYSDKKTILSRFRIIPPQPIVNHILQDYVAKQSITKTEQGYHWCFDPNFFAHFQLNLPKDIPSKVSDNLNLHLISGEKTAISTPKIIEMYKQSYPNITTSQIPKAYHAIMIDQPFMLTQELNVILNRWLSR